MARKEGGFDGAFSTGRTCLSYQRDPSGGYTIPGALCSGGASFFSIWRQSF